MSVTYGFYNSYEGDRRYDAVQVSSIFDGIIGDGVYETIGDCFAVKPLDGMTVSVGTGRAWFDHTWTLNDALYPVSIATASPTYNRYDIIAIEVNESTRINSIVYVPGVAASSPQIPTLTNDDEVHQYPLAYIYVKVGATSITTADITNKVGTSDCPFVIGVVEVMDIDYLIGQWSAQWDDYIKSQSSEFETWLAETKLEYERWFGDLQDQLDEDQAGNLQNQINDLKDLINSIISGSGIITNTIDDSDGNPIEDYLGNDLEGVIIMSYS